MFSSSRQAVAYILLLLSTAVCAQSQSAADKTQNSSISGKVTFKGQPVPAGYVSFEPDVATGGSVKVIQIKDGVYDSATASDPGLKPGSYKVRIAGFDGKRIPFFGQGKQIFNEIQDSCTIKVGAATQDFVVPESAGENVKIQRTADT